MLTAKTCPYVAIGVSAAAKSSEASAGFARATRRLKSRSDSPFTIEDLTSALNDIEAGSSSGALQYSVPANDALFKIFLPKEFGGIPSGETDRLVALVKAGNAPTNEQRLIELSLLHAALEKLFDWNWSEAVDRARDCLMMSTNESVRDEALNILGAAYGFMGETEKAYAALSKAVEGEWNLRLQANLALLATVVDPRRAVEQMSFLIDGAAEGNEKMEACRMAIGLWRQTQQEALGHDDDEQFEKLPDRLVASIVDLLNFPGISEEEFFDLGLFIARVAPRSVNRSRLAGSPWARRASGEIVAARAESFDAYIDNVVRHSRGPGGGEAFVRAHVDGLVDEVVQSFASGRTDLANVAFAFLEQGLDCSSFKRIWLRAMLVVALPHVLEEGGAPADVFMPWMTELRAAARQVQMPDETRSLTDDLVEDAVDVFCRVHLQHFVIEGSQAENLHNEILRQMSGGFLARLGTDKAAVQHNARLVVEWARNALPMLRGLQALRPADPGLKNNIDGFISETSMILQNMSRHA